MPLLIDTDPALGIWREGRPRDVDDGLAIVEAINTPALDLRGITVTFGNAELADGVRVAQELVRLKNSHVPVTAGAAEPMPMSGACSSNAAVDFMIAQLQQTPMRIAAIGPLTNIGLLLTLRPDLASRIQEVVIVAGRTAGKRFYLGDVGPVRDFNFENDVRAAQVLLDSDIAIVMAGFELSSQVTITEADLVTIRDKGGASCEYLHRNSLDWLRHWTRRFPADNGFHPWDSAAIAWFLRPELYATQQRGWRIRNEPLTAAEQRRNPDASPAFVPWLETSANLPGRRITYCTGFNEGATQQFIDAVIDGIW